MVIIILLNDIHSELISYCQTAIKQIRLCIRTILKYFQFVLNFRACEKHWSDSPGKRNINSKGRSSCTGSSYLLSGLFTGQCILGAEILQVRHCLSGSSQLQPSPAHSAADLKSLFPDGCSSSYSNYQESNTLASIFHYYSTHQE